MSKLKKSAEGALYHIKKAREHFKNGNKGAGMFHARHAAKLAEREAHVPTSKEEFDSFRNSRTESPHGEAVRSNLGIKKVYEHQPHVGPSRSEHQKIHDAKIQAEQEAHLRSPEGNKEREERNAKIFETSKLGKGTSIPHPQPKPKEAPIPSAPKPTLGKAKVDEGKNLEEKAQARAERNYRTADPKTASSIRRMKIHGGAHGLVHEKIKGVPRQSLGKAKVDNFDGGYKDKKQLRMVRETRNKNFPNFERGSVAPNTYGNKISLKTAHQQKLNEMKRMPKPNLPKSEDLDKAKVDTMIRGKTKEQVRAERREESSKPTGTLEGYHSTGRNTALGQLSRKRNLEERKAMPKPNLPKSDMYEDEEQLDKGDHTAGNPKIDAFYDGKYLSSTKWHKNLKSAYESALKAHADKIKDPSKLKVYYDHEDNKRRGLKKASDPYKASLPKAPQAPKLQSKPAPMPKTQSIKVQAPKPPKIKGM